MRDGIMFIGLYFENLSCITAKIGFERFDGDRKCVEVDLLL